MSVPSTAAASRTGRSTALTGLVRLLLAGALVRSVWLVLDSSIDLDVYRLGGMAVVDRHGFDDELYGSGLSLHGDGGLPFAYPPFAALLFVPPAYLPERLTELALGLASMGVAVVLSAVLLRYAAARGRPLPLPLPLQSLLGPLTAVAAGTAVLLWSGPRMRNVGLGQINALLMALVRYDLLRARHDTVLGRTPRGFWIGPAAGVKLTPLAFGLVFLVRGQLRPIRWDAWLGPLGASGPAIDVVVGTGCLALFLVLALWVGAGLRNGTGENGGTARG